MTAQFERRYDAFANGLTIRFADSRNMESRFGKDRNLDDAAAALVIR